MAIAALPPEGQRRALGPVDEPAPGSPVPGSGLVVLVAALVTTDSGGPHSTYRGIDAGSGCCLPDDRERLPAARQASMAAVHQHYRTP